MESVREIQTGHKSKQGWITNDSSSADSGLFSVGPHADTPALPLVYTGVSQQRSFSSPLADYGARGGGSLGLYPKPFTFIMESQNGLGCWAPFKDELVQLSSGRGTFR